jgi:hypothetical protein
VPSRNTWRTKERPERAAGRWKESIASKKTSPFSCRHGRLKTQNAAPLRNTGASIKPSSELLAVDSGEGWGPEGKRQKNLENRPHSSFVCEGAGAGRGPLRGLRKDARQGGLPEFVTKQIELIGIGADLKRPGSAAALVRCIGQHGRHKGRDEQNQDHDSQRFHFQTRSIFFVYLMKPLTLSIGSSGVGNLIEETTPAPFFHNSRKTKLSVR